MTTTRGGGLNCFPQRGNDLDSGQYFHNGADHSAIQLIKPL